MWKYAWIMPIREAYLSFHIKASFFLLLELDHIEKIA